MKTDRSRYPGTGAAPGRAGRKAAGLLAQQRQAFILGRIRELGGVRVADIARDLNVSDMTVRRDLEQLQDRGYLEKVHGGATAVPGGTAFEPAFATKSRLQQAEKEAIAEAAAPRVEAGMAIAISAGTTTYAVARRLVGVPRITVVTNSVPVADLFFHEGRADQTILLTGGVRTRSDALVGPFAVAALRTVHVDVAFIGVHGMDPRSGFTTPNLLEAETDRALIDAGRRLIVVADHTKWEMTGISMIARLDQADVLITDSGLPAEARATLAESVRQLVIAEPGASDAAAVRSVRPRRRRSRRPPPPSSAGARR